MPIRCARFVTVALLLTTFVSCAGMISVYTDRDLTSELDQVLSQLPPVELLPSSENKGATTLILRGQGALFNPGPPPDEGWLRGRISPRDYADSITAIDLAVSRSLSGLPRMYPPSEIPSRMTIKVRAAQVEVAALNAKWRKSGITFTWKLVEDSQHWKDSVLYIRVE